MWVLGCASGGANGRAGAMDDVKVTSSAVAGLETPGGEADGVLTLKDGTRCSLPAKDPRYAIWLRIIKGAQKEGLPVYLECAPGGGAARTLLPFAGRRIDEVQAAAGDQAEVLIFMSPSIHYLKTGRRDYAAMRALLEEAARTQEPVLLAVDPGSLEILAVVKPEPGASVTVI
jgi:hypothetical protein